MSASIEDFKDAAERYFVQRSGYPLTTFSPGLELRYAYQDNEAAFTRVTRLLRQDTTTYDVFSVVEIDPPELLAAYKIYKVILHIKKDTSWRDARIMADFLGQQSQAVALVGVRELSMTSGSWEETVQSLRDYLENVQHRVGNEVDTVVGKLEEGVLEAGETAGQFFFNLFAPLAVLALLGVYLWKR